MKYIRFLKIMLTLNLISMLCIYGVSLYTPKNAYSFDRRFTFISPFIWNNIASGMQKADQDLNTSTKFLGTDRMDTDRQIEALHTSISTKPDGIITAASADSVRFRAAIRKAIDAGIPVVLIDSDLPDSGRSCYIGTDNRQAGALAGNDMAAATEGKAAIAVIVSDLNYPNQSERLEAFEEIIKNYPDMEILEVLECHSERLELLERIPELIRNHPEVDALYLTEGIASAVTGEILSAQFGERKITVVASDDISEVRTYIENGIYYSAIAQKPWEQGYLAVQALNEMAAGKARQDIIYTDAYSITRENLDSTLPPIAEGILWNEY